MEKGCPWTFAKTKQQGNPQQRNASWDQGTNIASPYYHNQRRKALSN
jgi:hypothetical protein